jgi:hypothetical protein
MLVLRILTTFVLGGILYAQTHGPEPGSAIPDFELVDQNGFKRSLKTLTGPKGLVLVFYRSADW